MKDRDKEIVRLYIEEKKSAYYISKIYSCTVENIYRILNKEKVKRRLLIESNRRKKLNTHYFNKIDSEEKAYILGFLYADGCNTDHHKLIISLHEQDKDILEKIKISFEYEGCLKYRDFTNSQDKRANQWQLSIGSKELSTSLSQLGCVPRKSLILKFPTEDQVPSHLRRHFIRGYFDGDGGISSGRDWSANFTGTNEFLNGVQNELQKQLNFKFRNKYSRFPERLNNNYTIVYGGESCVFTLLAWLYEDSTFYLNRKFKKYKEFKNYYLNKLSDKAEFQDFLKSRVCSNIYCNNKWHSCGLCSTCYAKYKYPNSNTNDKGLNER